MGASDPAVTVVVPTRDRPGLVARAVRSALAQTMGELEVVVVLDGPDAATTASLTGIADDRLRSVVLPEPRGIGAARNAGVAAARGRWIGFLDDDDEWLDRKLEIQLETARCSRHRRPLVAGRLLAREGRGDRVWPRRLPREREPLSEYLLAGGRPFFGETLVHTSTILVDRELASAHRFREDLAKHEDLDWLLGLAATERVEVEFPATPEPVAVWHRDPDRRRTSEVPDWRGSLAWADGARDRMTRRAYASFLLAWIGADAARERSLEALWRLPVRALREGRPAAADLALYLGIWLVPRPLRRRAAALRRMAGA